MLPMEESVLRRAAGVFALDAATGEAVEAFRTRGIRTILLKGPVLTRWLYRHRLDRAYEDVDLLVSPHDFDAAASSLRGLGYREVIPERRFGIGSGVVGSHAKHFHRGGRRAADIDLHQGFLWSSMNPLATWQLLCENTDTMTIAGIEVAALMPSALALVVALHAAQHGTALGPCEDLDRALHRFDQPVWRQAAALAIELDAEDAFAAGLRLSPSGQQLAESLGLTNSASVEVQLLRSGNTQLAHPLQQLRSEPSLRRRLMLLYGKLLPSAQYMRVGYPIAKRGTVCLIYAYFYRAARLVRQLPHARRALTEARRNAA